MPSLASQEGVSGTRCTLRNRLSRGHVDLVHREEVDRADRSIHERDLIRGCISRSVGFRNVQLLSGNGVWSNIARCN